MLPIKPHLWFDQEAKQAAEFYATLMPDSAINYVNHFPMPGGECEIVEFTVAGQPFLGISAGHMLGINPSISFMINFDPSRDPVAAKHIDEVWSKLIENGKVLMPLDSYPFSERYGWVADKYGVSWQLILTNPAGEERPVIVPSLLFTEPVAGKPMKPSAFTARYLKTANAVTPPRARRIWGRIKRAHLCTLIFTSIKPGWPLWIARIRMDSVLTTRCRY